MLSLTVGQQALRPRNDLIGRFHMIRQRGAFCESAVHDVQ
jgi:hypothetical protein